MPTSTRPSTRAQSGKKAVKKAAPKSKAPTKKSTQPQLKKRGKQQAESDADNHSSDLESDAEPGQRRRKRARTRKGKSTSAKEPKEVSDVESVVEEVEIVKQLGSDDEGEDTDEEDDEDNADTNDEWHDIQLPRKKNTRKPAADLSTNNAAAPNSFDRRRQARKGHMDEEGWAAELCRFICDFEDAVSEGADLVKWWQTQVMKFAWRGNITDWAAINSTEVEEYDIGEYQDMLSHDILERQLDVGWIMDKNPFELK
ncbi:hypothetical protein JOM56_012865 [Amanita muscaria]